ncbi:hypothetical protein CK203_099479 [Vitis vinifera]|uniref:Uncharacterized protein n=1 Tax=Vitis vinifera TaxID=29760 RepID=A0A438D8N3_VITVI|nr:hypothetical protein CK203_099479 [Vitis vinifera]
MLPKSYVGANEASAIVTHLPKIKHLFLKGATIEKKNLVMILRCCRELVRLDVRDCFLFEESDAETLELASHIPSFRKAFKENGCLGLSGEVVWAKAHCPSALKRRAGMGLRGPLLLRLARRFLERPSSARGSVCSHGGCRGDGYEALAVEVEVAMELTSSRRRVTDVALMEEASRYYVVPIYSSTLGLRESSSSSSLWGHAEAVGASKGLIMERKEVGSVCTSVG